MTAGQVVIITGASRGIGAAIAQAFVRAGAAVVLAARNRAALETLRDDLIREGGEALAVPTDVTVAEDCSRLVDRTLERYGRLDTAVNGAASHSGRPTPLADTDPDAFDQALHVGVRGLFLSMRAQIPAIRESGGGAIVNIASTAGIQAVGGLVGYVTAKSAIIGLSKTAALDYAAHGIRVNVLAPGPIHTEQLDQAGPTGQARAAAAVPAQRLGRPDEVAAAAVWLCSQHAAFITGATVVIDGGLLAGIQPFTGTN